MAEGGRWHVAMKCDTNISFQTVLLHYLAILKREETD